MGSIGFKVIILLFCIGIINCGKCPAQENNHLIEPCVCDEDRDEINCNSEQNFNVRKVFEYLTQTVDWRANHFKRLVLSAPQVTQLDETTFYEILFDEIYIINAQNLLRIHSNAFGKTRQTTTTLVISGANQLNSSVGYSLWDALSSFNNIHSISINGINVNEMPDYAFRPLLGNQWNLTEVEIIGDIEKVGNYVFYDPSYHMKTIKLGNKINFIATHAFDIRTISHEPLTIDLSNNQLAADSFESVGVFLNAKRVLNLNLTNNKITHFDEFIFEPFLDLNVMNQIDIKDNLLVCDCRMKWLLKNKVNYERQVSNAICTDGRSLWSYSMDEISECKITDVIV